MAGKPLEEFVVIEIFAGTARVSSALRFYGMKSSFGVDHLRHRNACAPISIIDLTTKRGQKLLMQWMQNPRVIGLFLAPPCGMASRARSIRLAAARFGGPRPLLTVENPQYSHFWATTFWLEVAGMMLYTIFHSCQFGSTRQKKTMLAHNDPAFHSLHKLCPGESKTHRHDKWGLTKNNKFATSDETAYPFELARDIAGVFVSILLKNGVQPPPQVLSDVTSHSNQVLQALRAQTGTQPRATRLPPLVPEFKTFLKRPADSSQTDVPNAKRIACNPFTSSRMMGGVDSLESGQGNMDALASSEASSANVAEDKAEEVWGIYHEPMEFVQEAAKTGHPQNLSSCLPEVLRQAVRVNATTTDVQRARSRTELEPEEKKLKAGMSQHLQVILKDKKIKLWERLLQEAQYPDMQVAQEFINGTRLTGETEFCGLWPSKFSPALVSEDELAEISKRDKWTTLERVANSPNAETDQQVWQKTMSELERGWLVGPLDPEQVPDEYTLSRRFGVVQGPKVRCVDDFTRSSVNLVQFK